MVKTSDEKYLRAVYHLVQDKNNKVSLSELAYYLDLKPPTVLERVRVLQNEKCGYFTKKKKALSLQKQGKKKR